MYIFNQLKYIKLAKTCGHNVYFIIDCSNYQLEEISSDYINQLSKHLISGSSLEIQESVGRGQWG